MRYAAVRKAYDQKEMEERLEREVPNRIQLCDSGDRLYVKI